MMTQKEYIEVVEEIKRPSFKSMKKMENTIKELWDFMEKLIPILFNKQPLIFKFIPIIKIIKIGRISYIFIEKVYKIWKHDN